MQSKEYKDLIERARIFMMQSRAATSAQDAREFRLIATDYQQRAARLAHCDHADTERAKSPVLAGLPYSLAPLQDPQSPIADL